MSRPKTPPPVPPEPRTPSPAPPNVTKPIPIDDFVDEPSQLTKAPSEWARMQINLTIMQEAVQQLTKRVSELERARDAMRQEMLEWYRERERRGKIP